MKPGRLRIQAAAILTAACPELLVQPEHIEPAAGHWRTSRYADVYRWELFTVNRLGYSVHYGCWQTLTEFVKEAKQFGCVVENQEISSKCSA